MNKQPEVTARTRKKFMDAFWSLAEKKNINQISVGELSRLAGYNRSTFYEYFTDMPDLIARAEEEMLDQIRQKLREEMPKTEQGGLEQRLDMFRVIFLMINEPMYCLLGPNGDPSFFSRVKELFAPTISEMLGMQADSAYFDYIVAYAYSAALGFLQHWHDRGCDLPEDDFYRLGYDLMTYGVLGTLTREE